MVDYGLPVLFTLWVWWFSTGAILYLVGLPRRTYGVSLAAATVLLVAAGYGLALCAKDTSVSGAYVAFGCAILIWGWHEIMFLTGLLAGPNRRQAQRGLSGFARFKEALLAILFHEIALLITAGVVVALTWDGPNTVGLWTFMVLWWMRLSAKLNLYFGVSNIPDEFLVPHLAYLDGYFRRRSMNWFFPLSVGVSTIVTVLLVVAALAPEATRFETVSYVLLASLLGLAVLEHWFLILPIPVMDIWKWSLRSRSAPASESMPAVVRNNRSHGQ
ncbi:MAG: putative photosynthetic complex assembly protein PuhE [Rhodospirillaceae bacterium]|nr:putative photosynthetic complex assembly protein PuhE [Rhodospirillaceae bacterium]MCY4311551.1 putative photosynthetic complex assembly protein PuhE [Rhodospirillaceae bacterium]